MSESAMLLSYYFSFILSALVPWVNAEVLALSMSAVSSSPFHMAALAFLASAGQMTGKCILYWTGRGTIPIRGGRFDKPINRWKDRFEKSPSKSIGLVFVSAVFGIPPFYIITILSGVFRLDFGRFVAAGFCGRLIHFGVLVLMPQIGRRIFRFIIGHL
jgi:membrane protein YqaA with SNARE-associated domain